MEEELTIYEKQLTDKQKLVVYFLVYSFLGWVLETVFALFVQKTFVKRGFLYGPACPIYGFGAVLFILLLHKTKGKKILEFFVSMVAFSIFEYAVSFALEMIFHLRWWDYTQDFWNINGRISIAYSFAWGAIGVIFNEKLHPAVSKKLDKAKNAVSYHAQKAIIIIIPIIMIVDFVLSSIKYLNQ